MVNWENEKTERGPERKQAHDAARLGGEPPERQSGKRKNTRRWCKGKVGVEHITEIRPYDPKWPSEKGKTCHWWPWGKTGRGVWICTEQIVCTACGKILRHSLGKSCTKRVVSPSE